MKCFLCLATLLMLPVLTGRAAEADSGKFVSSTWYAGTGPRTQIWMLTVRGNAITGYVCGPCDDPRSFAPIVDGKVVDAEHITFFIQHDLRGGLMVETGGPYRNEVRVAIHGDKADFNSHLENQAWTSHPVHQDWTLLSKRPS